MTTNDDTTQQDDTVASGNKGGKVTPAIIKDRINKQLKQARLKALETKAKEKIEAIIKAEGVVSGLNEELDDIFNENQDLFE